jgi:predicted RNA methylase
MTGLAAREADRLHEQARLDADRSAAERNRAGQFATPPALAAEVVRAALAHLPTAGPLAVLEPAVGSGAFVSALLRSPAAGRVRRMVGVEADARFAAVAARLWGPAGLEVLAGDFTASPPAGRFDLVIANPPYVRHHHLPADQKRRLQAAAAAVVGEPVSGLAGLYVHFLLLAHGWLAPDAVAAWLVPAEFLDVNYGRAVRHYLGRRVDLLGVHRFAAADVQFGDALVSSAVILYRNRSPGREPVRFTAGPSLADPTATVAVPRTRLSAADKWGRLFAADAPASDDGPTLGDLFVIRRGLATGNNDFFILPRQRAAELRLPEAHLRPVLPSPRHLTGDVIAAASDGRPDLAPDLVLLDCRMPHAAVAACHPALADYLAAGERSGVAAGYLCSRRTPWYAQEDRPPAPFLVPYMGRGRGGESPFRFIRNYSRATAANVYLMLYPRGPLAHRLSGRSDDRLEAIHTALRAISGGTVSAGGRIYGGGLQKVEPGELAALPAGGVWAAAGGGPDGLFDNLVPAE